jgi:hypothetical protein
MNKMELLKNLELVAVDYENNGKKAVMTFLDTERAEVRRVNFNLQSYDTVSSKFVDDPEKEKKVVEWCDTYFGTTFDNLGSQIGTKKDIYAYDTFNSLWECEIVEKFKDEDFGEFFSTTISEITDDGNAIRIKFPWNGKTYESKMTYATYLDSMKQWFVDPQKKQETYKKFADKFHTDISNKDSLIGHQINVEVKKAFNKFMYADIKKFPDKKGKK